MSQLDFVTPEDAPETWKILLYGPAGNGKTTGALSAPGPVLLLNADGPDASRFAHKKYGDKIREVRVTGPETLDQAYLALANPPEPEEGKSDVGTTANPFKTVVLDPLGEIHQKLLDVISKNGKISLPNRGDVGTKVERFVRSLRELDIVNVVIVCHEELFDGGDDGVAVLRPMTGGGKLPEKIMGMMSTVAYVGVIPATEDQPRRTMAQLVETSNRRAKDRMGLGLTREVDLTEWIEAAAEAGLEPDTTTKEEAK